MKQCIKCGKDNSWNSNICSLCVVNITYQMYSRGSTLARIKERIQELSGKSKQGRPVTMGPTKKILVALPNSLVTQLKNEAQSEGTTMAAKIRKKLES